MTNLQEETPRVEQWQNAESVHVDARGQYISSMVVGPSQQVEMDGDQGGVERAPALRKKQYIRADDIPADAGSKPGFARNDRDVRNLAQIINR